MDIKSGSSDLGRLHLTAGKASCLLNDAIENCKGFNLLTSLRGKNYFYIIKIFKTLNTVERNKRFIIAAY
jgi:hypothetical protein